MYHVDRVVRETGQKVKNGQSEIYVNAKVKDRTSVSELMEYFTDSNGRKEICPKLSDRVMLFKTEQKEVTEMCELMEKERLAGWEEGREQGREQTELMLLKKYMKKHRVSYDEAFDELDIAEERYGVYLEKIEQKE